MNASITLTTITRALRNNAYLRPVCTALEVEWLCWDGQKTWTVLSEDKLVEGHLRSQSLEIQDKASNCITDYCVVVGRLICSQFAHKPTRSKKALTRKKALTKAKSNG